MFFFRTRATKLLAVLGISAMFLLMPLHLSAAVADLPSTVTSRLKKIDGYMAKVEASLIQKKADRNNLERAQEAYKEIKSGYPQHLDAPEVKAALKRIEDGENAIKALEGELAQNKENKKSDEVKQDQIAEDWAAKLDVYKSNTDPSSKGYFGCPTMDPKVIVQTAPLYKEAKALYAEFQAAGIDKDSHWKLRDAEYNIKTSIKVYEESIGNITREAEEKVKIALAFLKEQKGKENPLYLSGTQMPELADFIKSIQLVLPATDERRKSMEADWAAIQKLQSEIEKIVLKKRKMKPDVYKKADSASIKALAKSIVLKDGGAPQVLRIHITSANWEVESAVEWTDTTKTAVQSRTTKGVYVQVALKKAGGWYLHTLFIHKDTIGGNAGGLTGHIMFRDKFLQENLPK